MFGATLAALLLAAGSGWLEAPAIGFAFCALAWMLLQAAAMLARFEAPPVLTAGSGGQGWLATMLDLACDAVLVLLLHVAMPPLAGTSQWLALALPVTFVLLTRTAGQLPLMNAAATIADRSVLALILAGLAAFGLVDWAIAAATVVISAMILAATARRGG
jgi:hypothetical protein